MKTEDEIVQDDEYEDDEDIEDEEEEEVEESSLDLTGEGRKIRRRFRIKKIGILSAGSDVPGINAVVRAAVKTAQYRYKWRVAGIRDGFEGLVRRPRITNLTYDNVAGLERRSGMILGATNRGNPFAWKEEESGKIIISDYSKKLVGTMRRQGIDALLIIGGDGTMQIGHELHKTGVRLVGIHKTLDNDLPAADMTFGFDTAVATATDAIDKLQTTTEGNHRALIIETMGRHTGHIALHAGIAGGADIILIPEIPFDYDEICRKLFERNRRGRSCTIICVAEGARPKDGEMVVHTAADAADESSRLGGIGAIIAAKIHDLTGLETRFTALGHLLRGGAPTARDRILCTRLGMSAVHAMAERKWGRMVVIRGTKIRSIPIPEGIGDLRKVDPEGDLVQHSKLMGISFGD